MPENKAPQQRRDSASLRSAENKAPQQRRDSASLRSAENKAPQQRRDSASLRSASRTPLIAANWKMHKTTAETADFFERFVGELGELAGVEVAIAPPFPALPIAVDRTRRSP